MNRTKIEWALNPDGTLGYTWNPITGCLNGCEYCYARKLANTRLKERYLENHNISLGNCLHIFGHVQHDVLQRAMHDPFYPRFWPEKLDQPLKHKKPAGIFTCDMSDLFGIGVPEQWTWSVFNFIEKCPQHRFYLLTKQPQNLIKFSPFPENCWAGFTATNTKMFADSIIKSQGLKAGLRFISFEPLLEWHWSQTYPEPLELVLKAEGIDWVIIGAQTKPYKPPKMEWAEEIVEACDKAGIPIFEKENLRLMYAKGNNVHPNMIGLRQEMPSIEQDR